MPEHRTLWLSAEAMEVVRQRAESAGVFGGVSIRNSDVVGEASGSGAPAEYVVTESEGRVWVMLRTADRWLSQSIEQDLMHTGDKLEELIEEELADLGYEGVCGKVEHFRDDEKRFVFRTAAPVRDHATAREVGAVAAVFLLALEAAFRPLGDMEAGDENE